MLRIIRGLRCFQKKLKTLCGIDGDKLDGAQANTVGPRYCLPDGQPDPDRLYWFLGRPADVTSGFRAAKIRQTVHGGPALPREQVVAFGRRRAALQVWRPAEPEVCEHDRDDSI